MSTVTLLDARGEPLPLTPESRRNPLEALMSSYYGASDAREFKSWFPGTRSADADYLPEQHAITGRGRDLGRNDALSSGYLRTARDTVIGTNFRLRPRPNIKLLQQLFGPRFDAEWAKDFSDQVVAQWEDYSGDPEQFDVARKRNATQYFSQCIHDGLANGDACIIPYWLPGRGNASSTMFQMVESDRLCNPQFQPDTTLRRGGIDLDRFGASRRYWITNQHPGDWYFSGLIPTVGLDWRPIPARFSGGRLRFVHVHDPNRTGETRGISAFAPIMGDSRLGNRYRLTELAAALAGAMITSFSESPADIDSILNMLGDPADHNFTNQFEMYMAARAEYIAKLEPMTHIQMFPGEKHSGFAPGRPNSNAADFLKANDTYIGAGLNVPRPIVTKDFSDINYSSYRGMMNEVWRFWTGRRSWIATNAASPCYALWLEEQTQRELGDPLRIDLGTGDRTDFYRAKSAFCRAAWEGPGRGFNDPLKEAQAARERIDMGLTSLEYESWSLLGLDWEETFMQREREIEMMRGAGRSDGDIFAEVVRTTDPVTEDEQ